jgi:hypothetical protein
MIWDELNKTISVAYTEDEANQLKSEEKTKKWYQF